MSKKTNRLDLVVTTSVYPSILQPQTGTFVRTLFQELVKRDVDLKVIAPQSRWKPKADSGLDGDTMIFRPPFTSCSNFSIKDGWSTFRLTVSNFARSALQMTSQIHTRPSMSYGHFLFPAGYAALKLAQYWQIPSVVALGESTMSFYEKHIGLDRTRRMIQEFSGILSVSEENRAYCIDRLRVPEERVICFPNASDTSHFYPRDRVEMRKKLGLPLGGHLVIFVGHLDERKGAMRVFRAVQKLSGVRSIFLGKGPNQPQGEQVLFCGTVPHDQIPEWLCAADLFVLPTLAEGSSNAVSEALACGLPVVASNISPNQEAVGSDAGILVDPMDEAALSKAIQRILETPETHGKMSTAALARAQSYSLADRSERIHGWLHQIYTKESN